MGYAEKSTRDSDNQNRTTIEDIVHLSEFSGLGICPRENLIAARTDKANISENKTYHNWMIIDWPSRKVLLKADAGETINSFGTFESVRPQWSPDCQWIYYRARVDGEVQVWRLNALTGETEKITSDGADVLSFELAKNGRELIYKVGPKRSAISAAEAWEYEHGILYDENIYPLHPPLTRTFPILGRWSVARLWNIVGKRGHLLSKLLPKYKRLRVSDRKALVASEAEVGASLEGEQENADWVNVANAGVTISPAGERAVAKKITKTYRISGHPLATQLVSISRNDPSKERICAVRQCKGEHQIFLKWSQDRSTIYFINEETRGAAGIYAWALETDEVRTIFETEGVLGALASVKRYESMSCPIMNNIAFCTAADHSAPPRLLGIDLTSGSAQTVFDPNTTFREKFDLKTERIRWTDEFERNSLGILVYPRNFKAGNRYPLIITTYLCRGFLNGGIADGGPEYVLAENGFFALCIDHNAELPPQEKTASYSPGPGRFVAAYSEYKSAVDLLADQGLIDRERVGITGLSFGAHGISYSLTRSSHYFHAAAVRSLGTIGPESEILITHPNSKVHTSLMKNFNIAEDGRNREVVFDDLAITRRANLVQAPILVQASESEYLPNLPAIHALLKRNKPVEMHIFPDETHTLFQPRHRFVNYARNVDWFRFWLQGYEDQAPGKASQYDRWRKMRAERCAWDEPEDEKPSYCEYSNAVH